MNNIYIMEPQFDLNTSRLYLSDNFINSNRYQQFLRETQEARDNEQFELNKYKQKKHGQETNKNGVFFSDGFTSSDRYQQFLNDTQNARDREKAEIAEYKHEIEQNQELENLMVNRSYVYLKRRYDNDDLGYQMYLDGNVYRSPDYASFRLALKNHMDELASRAQRVGYRGTGRQKKRTVKKKVVKKKAKK